MATIQKHFVTFYSPGTFVPETSQREIESWDVPTAVKLAHDITERYGATPYGFTFSTRTRGDDDLDSKVTATSAFHWLGGRVETREEVFARNDPKEDMLRRNMECNDIKQIVINDNSWRSIGALEDTHVMVDFTPKPRMDKKP